MRLLFPAGAHEGLLSGSPHDLARLADAVATGEGILPTTAPQSDGAVAAIEIHTTSGAGVRLDLDQARGILLITGDPAARKTLADNLRAIATDASGGHLHIDYFPDHLYLREGSLSLVVESPHGGIPNR